MTFQPTSMKRVKAFFYRIYMAYLFIFCCIDLEPWEQVVIHTFSTTVVTMVAFTAYVFIPIHLRLAFQFFLQLLK
uniref:Serine palmitoyltransferase small subunit B n=1 Tax=Salvator merianae TaxID=96440 RepID=A0A8D0AZB1_SALMN